MTTHPSPTAPEQDPALAPLLALYATLRGGAPVDPRDLVVAVGMAVCQGADVGPTLRAIGELAFVHLNHLGGADGAYLCAAALEQGGWLAAIHMASLLGWSEVWAAAMTAHYGPTGTHASRLGEDGRPTAETLAAFPRLVDSMTEAAARFERLVGWYERTLRVTRWDGIVEVKRGVW